MWDIIQSVWREARSLFPSGNTEEKIGFARFHSKASENELNSLSNGVKKKTVNHRGTSVASPDGSNCSEVGTNGETAFPFEAEDDEFEDDKRSERNKISEWQAGWNVTNAIQGMFIVSFPYTVLGGGYEALICMALIAYVCCYTGKILVDCLYEEDASGVRHRVRTSYVSIASHVWGHRIGGRVVYTAQLIELLMTCILYVLLCGDLMIGSFPNTPLDLSSWIMLCSTFLLPCAFLKNLRHVSTLSFWCTVAHMFINAIILIFCFTKAPSWKWSDVHFEVDIRSFPISLGIITFSYTSQIFLPTLEGNMIRKDKFRCMMHWTHVAAAAFKVIFSYIGFITFGMATKEVITNNLPNHTLRVVVNLFLVIKALLSYPLPYFAAADLLEDSFFKDNPFPTCYDVTGSLRLWGLVVRLILVVVTVLMGIFIPHFAILMGLIGSVTGNMLSLIWPCYFHLRIKGNRLPWYSKAWDCIIILFGLVCGGLGFYYSAYALDQAFKGIEIKPFHHAGPLRNIPAVVKVTSSKP